MKKVKLGDICEISAGGTPSRSRSEFWNNGTIPWLKIKDLKSKYVDSSEEFISEMGLNSSSAKLFSKGTILYTIFATIGEVAILDFDATTNQAIAGLSVKSDNVLRDYLFYFLQSIKDKVKSDSRGVAQNNINLGYLKSVDVPLVSMKEQQEICVSLDRVNDLVEIRQQQLLEFDNLVKSRFVEMFGDPVINTKNLPKEKLSNIGLIGRGVSKHRPRNAPELLGGNYPLIQTSEIANSDLYVLNYENTYSELGYSQSKLWNSGTLCITIAANIAKTAILSFAACFPDSIVGFVPNEKSNVIFINYWFKFFQKIIENQAPESAQKNINLKILGDLDVILPTIDKQNQFADFVEQIDKSKLAVKQSLEELETLKKKLMQDYFE